jgi:putative SOS response-associated peptidase YedK
LLGEYQLAEAPEFAPHYNVAPTQDVVAIRQTDNGAREAVPLRWGLVPHWAQDLAIGNRMINARGETVADKPAFRHSFKTRRCIIPASGFYEWAQTEAGKWPYFITAESAPLLSMAGIWARWQKGDAAAVETCAIVTVPAAPALFEIHARMPLCLSTDAYADWLDPATPDEVCRELLTANDGPTFAIHPVGRAVNNPRNDSADLVARVDVPLDSKGHR